MNAPITAEALLAKLKILPPERLGQIADFVDFLATQEQRRQAGEELRVMMDKLADANIPPMTMAEIQVEVDAVRKARRERAGRRA